MMAIPANDLWAKIQKELSGKSNGEQMVIIQRYLDEWPDEWKGPYQELKDRIAKLVRKLQTTESVRSSSGRDDPFHVKRDGDGQVGIIGLANSGKSAIVATLTNARAEVSDYPFTTQFPLPGMLRYKEASIQLVDTPAIIVGLAKGEGAGQRLLQLIRLVDVLGVVIDLAQEPLAQMEVIRQELAASNCILLPRALGTVLHSRGKGGITFKGTPISKGERSTAARMLTEHGIQHAELIVRKHFSADELRLQIERKQLIPSVIIANKNDVPGAADQCARLREAYPAYNLVDVNFLDAANFDVLRAQLFDLLGLIRVYLLDKSVQDATKKSMILRNASTIGDIVKRLAPPHQDQVVQAKIWGPSVKYPGQVVGLEHLVLENDLIYL